MSDVNVGKFVVEKIRCYEDGDCKKEIDVLLNDFNSFSNVNRVTTRAINYLGLPESMWGTLSDPVNYEQLAVHFALASFVAHQSGNDIKSNPMHKKGCCFGKAVSELVELGKGNNLSSITDKLCHLSDTYSSHELANGISYFILLFKSKNIPLDYYDFANDIYQILSSNDGGLKIAEKWATDFIIGLNNKTQWFLNPYDDEERLRGSLPISYYVLDKIQVYSDGNHLNEMKILDKGFDPIQTSDRVRAIIEAFKGMPESLMDVKNKISVYIALTFFAAHQSGKNIKTNPMNINEEKATFGKAVSDIIDLNDNNEYYGSYGYYDLLQPIQNVLRSKDINEFIESLKPFIISFNKKNIQLDYGYFASNLHTIQEPPFDRNILNIWIGDFINGIIRNSKNG